MTNYPYATTLAARFLAEGLRLAASERGLSLREIGRRLGYSQAVVLSHMAKGRVQIPLGRACEIADEVGLQQRTFLLAVLEQRHPEVQWDLITGAADPLATALEQTAGKRLCSLSPSHRRVLHDVVRDSDPEERWISISEIPAVRLLRELYPLIQSDGLTPDDAASLRLAVSLDSEPRDGES